MPNVNRAAGDYFEYQTRDALRRLGWFVIRAAGSHGPADLVALRAGNTPLLVSCKVSGRISRADRIVLLDAADVAGGRPILATRPRRGRVQLSTILREGTRVVAVDLLAAPKTKEINR